MKIKSKIRLREGRAIGGELGVRIVEGGNGLCMMFKPQCVHILHFLTKPGEPVVIEMSFPYTDREEFVTKLYRWSCPGGGGQLEYGNLIVSKVDFRLLYETATTKNTDVHSMSHTFITNFKQKLKAALEDEVIEEVEDNPMPDEYYTDPKYDNPGMLVWTESAPFTKEQVKWLRERVDQRIKGGTFERQA